jgi:predicted nucleic acid-binding protein
LDQARSEDVRRFLDSTPPESLFLSDFSLHSIGLIMMRLNRSEQFLHLVQDVLVEGGVGLVSLLAKDMGRLVQVAAQFRLDFDDAYQYVAAETHDLRE